MTRDPRLAGMGRLKAPKRSRKATGLAGILTLLFWVGGIVAALYVGVWVLLVGGIEQFVRGVTATPVSGSDIAWGVVRVVFCESAVLLGWVGFILGAGIVYLFGHDE